MNMHQRIKEQTELARIYAKDGAFRTAARVFRNLAEEIEVHANQTDPTRPHTGRKG